MDAATAFGIGSTVGTFSIGVFSVWSHYFSRRQPREVLPEPQIVHPHRESSPSYHDIDHVHERHALQVELEHALTEITRRLTEVERRLTETASSDELTAYVTSSTEVIRQLTGRVERAIGILEAKS